MHAAEHHACTDANQKVARDTGIGPSPLEQPGPADQQVRYRRRAKGSIARYITPMVACPGAARWKHVPERVGHRGH